MQRIFTSLLEGVPKTGHFRSKYRHIRQGYAVDLGKRAILAQAQADIQPVKDEGTKITNDSFDQEQFACTDKLAACATPIPSLSPSPTSTPVPDPGPGLPATPALI